MKSLEDQQLEPTSTAGIGEQPSIDPAGNPAVDRRWSWSSARGRMAVLLFVASLVFAGQLLRTMNRRAYALDFSHYYVSALMMRLGQDPYVTDIKPTASSVGVNVHNITLATYPPTFLLFFEPLTLLDPFPAYWVWSLMNIAALALAIYFLLEGLPTPYPLRLFLVALVILYPPINNNFFQGQPNTIFLLLFILFMRWSESGKQAWVGAVVGLAGLLKMFPLLLLGYLFLRRQWKAIFYAGLVILVGGIFTFATLGFTRTMNFSAAIPSVTSQRWLGRFNNVALVSIISHFFWLSASHRLGSLAGLSAHLSPGMDLTRRVTVWIGQLTVLAFTVYATLKSSPSKDGSDQHVIALWVYAAVMLAPTAWVHYLVMLLLSYGVLLRLYWRGEAPTRAVWFGLASFALGELLIAIDLAPLFWSSAFNREFNFWGTLTGWPASLVLGFVGVYLLARDVGRRPAAEAVMPRGEVAAS